MKAIDSIILEKIKEANSTLPKSYIDKVDNTLLGLAPRRNDYVVKHNYKNIYIAAVSIFVLVVGGSAAYIGFRGNPESEIEAVKKEKSNISTDTQAEKTEETLSKEDIANKGKSMALSIFGEDISEYRATVDNDEYGIYYMYYSDQEGEPAYFATIDKYTGEVYEIEKMGNDNRGENIAVDEDKYVEQYKAIEEIINTKLKVGEEVESVYCDYNKLEESNTLFKGTVSYIVRMKNDECYVFTYSQVNDGLFDVMHLNYSNYQRGIDEGASKREKRGVTRIRLELSKL